MAGKTLLREASAQIARTLRLRPAASAQGTRLLAAVFFVSATSHAGGFAITEQDASASGRAGTALAAQGTASSIHYNPAGLGFLRGPAAQAGVTGILPQVTAVDRNANDTNAQSGLSVPPHVYAAWGFEKFALGVGFNTPFGGGVKWPDDWYGRTELTEMSLRVYAGHAGGAYRVLDNLSVGASVQVYGVTVALTRRLDFVDTEGTARLAGSGVAVGAQLGVDWAPHERVQLGLMGRIPATASLSGRAHFESVPSSFHATLPDQAIRSSVTLPAKVALGGRFDLSVFQVYADVEVTFWQSFQRFEIDFENEATPDVSQPRNWAPGPTFRLGAERALGNAVLRAGGVVDLAVSPSDTLSPSQPDSDRFGVALGAGYRVGQFRGDFAYQFVIFRGRAATGEAFPAGYLAHAHLLALTLGYTQN